MLERKSKPASGVQVQHTDWGIIAKGTREMLARHEFAQDGLFPGDVGAQGKQRHTTTDPAGREIRIYRKSKYQFEVWRTWSPDEKAAHQLQQDRERKIEDAQRQVAAWPASPGEYRERCRSWADKFMEMAQECFAGDVPDICTGGGSGGYRFDDKTLAQVAFLADQIRGLVEVGTVVKDTSLRVQQTPACIAKTVRAADAARRDQAFQKFIANVRRGQA